MQPPKVPWGKEKIANPKPKVYAEAEIQRAIAKWFRVQYPYYRRLMTLGSFGENIGARRMKELKLLGLEAGHVDLTFKISRNGFHGFEMEVKKPNGVLSQAQKEIHTLLRREGYKVVIVYSVEEGISSLKEYLSSAIVS